MNIVHEEMITYTWSIDSVDTMSYGEYEKVIKKIYFTVTGSYEEHSHSISEIYVLKAPFDFSRFKEFEEVTEDEVVSWMKDTVDAAKIRSYEAEISKVLTEKVYPTYTNRKLLS